MSNEKERRACLPVLSHNAVGEWRPPRDHVYVHGQEGRLEELEGTSRAFLHVCVTQVRRLKFVTARPKVDIVVDTVAVINLTTDGNGSVVPFKGS